MLHHLVFEATALYCLYSGVQTALFSQLRPPQMVNIFISLVVCLICILEIGGKLKPVQQPSLVPGLPLHVLKTN